MLGSIIVFRILPNNSKLQMNKFCREFYGYKMKSNYGRYTYEKEGFLAGHPHIKPLRGVIVVRKEDAEPILSFLESYNADIYARDIILQREDEEQLRVKGD